MWVPQLSKKKKLDHSHLGISSNQQLSNQQTSNLKAKTQNYLNIRNMNQHRTSKTNLVLQNRAISLHYINANESTLRTWWILYSMKFNHPFFHHKLLVFHRGKGLLVKSLIFLVITVYFCSLLPAGNITSHQLSHFGSHHPIKPHHHPRGKRRSIHLKAAPRIRGWYMEYG